METMFYCEFIFEVLNVTVVCAQLINSF